MDADVQLHLDLIGAEIAGAQPDGPRGLDGGAGGAGFRAAEVGGQEQRRAAVACVLADDALAGDHGGVDEVRHPADQIEVAA